MCTFWLWGMLSTLLWWDMLLLAFSVNLVFPIKSSKHTNLWFCFLDRQMDSGEQPAIVKASDDLHCPRITRWPSCPSIPQWSRLTTRTKEPIRPGSHFVVKKGLVLSEHSLPRFLFLSIGAGGTQVHCSLADGSWSYQGNSSNPPFFYHFFSYQQSIECYLLSHRQERSLTSN